MMKKLLLIFSLMFLTACSKTELVPQLYMPAPPEILMRAPKELQTIKQEETPPASDEKKEIVDE